VDVPTIHSADPLIFPLSKHFCGWVHCPDERWFSSFANQVFSHEFFCLVWLKDWNNIPWLLFYPLQDNQQTNAFSIPKHQRHDLSCWWNRPCRLWHWTTVFCPLFWLLFGFWCVMVNPIFVKMLQALFRDFHASAFLICCEQAQLPCCAKLFHIQCFMQNISYTFFWNDYSLSNFIHFHPPVIQYHIVHLFNDFWCCCTFWTSFTSITFKAGTATFKLGRPFLNCWKRRQLYKTNYLTEWLAISHGCLWQMYQLRKKKSCR